MSNKMWGGRFEAGPDALMEEINASIDFDRKLAEYDISGSLAHVAMLATTGIISEADARAISEALSEVRGEIEKGNFELFPRPRRHPYEYRIAACGADRPRRRTPAHRTLAQ